MEKLSDSLIQSSKQMKSMFKLLIKEAIKAFNSECTELLKDTRFMIDGEIDYEIVDEFLN